MNDFEEKNEWAGSDEETTVTNSEQGMPTPEASETSDDYNTDEGERVGPEENTSPAPTDLNHVVDQPDSQSDVFSPSQPDFSQQPNAYTQGTYGYNPNPTGAISFSDVEKNKSERTPNTGFRTFLIILCVVLVVTIASGGGYIFGRSSSSKTGTNNSFTSGALADRPAADAEQETPSYVYNQVVGSIVLIDVYSTDDTSAGSQASGVVYSKDGYIVTNDHIYADIQNPKFLVTFSDGTQLDATYVAGDSRSDLAVLKVDATNLQAATFGDSSQALIGEEVVAIGNPGGSELSFSLTEGSISAVDRWAANNSNYSMKFIQIDAAINPGNSGGALCNMYGQVIGITAWKYVGEYYENVAFAIPSTTVKRICDDLIANGTVLGRAKLGIKYQMVDAVSAKLNDYGKTGLLIGEITSGTPIAATNAQVGDLITQINGKDITTSSVVLQTLEDSSPGETVTLTILSGKDGSTYTVDVELLEDQSVSSYTTEKSDSDTSSSYSGGEFDFPDGD